MLFSKLKRSLAAAWGILKEVVETCEIENPAAWGLPVPSPETGMMGEHVLRLGNGPLSCRR